MATPTCKTKSKDFSNENNMKTIVELKNLVKKFPLGTGSFTALNGVNLQFTEGEFTGFVGPSGSGKTTLLNIIGSLDVPTEGEVMVLGKSVGRLTLKQAAKLRKEELGFIFQNYNLLPVYTVFENVEFPLLLLNLSMKQMMRWSSLIRHRQVIHCSYLMPHKVIIKKYKNPNHI